MNQATQHITAGTSVFTFIAAMEISDVNEYLSAASFLVSIVVGLVYVYFRIFKSEK